MRCFSHAYYTFSAVYMDEDKPTAAQHQQDGLALVFHCPPSMPAAHHNSKSRARFRQPFTLCAGPWHLHWCVLEYAYPSPADCRKLFRHTETVVQHQAVSPGIHLLVTCRHTGIEPACLQQHHTDWHPAVPAPSSAVGDECCSQIAVTTSLTC